MNVLSDFVGHADLYYSMHALFERRLGWTLYRPLTIWEPIGVHTAMSAHTGNIHVDDTGITRCYIPTHDYTQACISLDQFHRMKFDVIVSTSWTNEVALFNLHKKTPGSIFIRQIANLCEVPVIKEPVNVLLSMLTPMPAHVNFLYYHPEHHSGYQPLVQPVSSMKIKSYSNHLRSYPLDIKMWQDAKAALPEYSFFMHGDSGDDMGIPQQELPASMQDAMFVWHTKGNGCCGYVAREALSCGKPLIVNKKYCETHKTLALHYLKDGINCIDLDPRVRSFTEGMNLIREWSRPDVYPQICNNVINQYKKDIRFQEEAEVIGRWIRGLWQHAA